MKDEEKWPRYAVTTSSFREFALVRMGPIVKFRRPCFQATSSSNDPRQFTLGRSNHPRDEIGGTVDGGSMGCGHCVQCACCTPESSELDAT